MININNLKKNYRGRIFLARKLILKNNLKKKMKDMTRNIFSHNKKKKKLKAPPQGIFIVHVKYRMAQADKVVVARRSPIRAVT